MRLIVSFCGSPTYQLSRYLTTILQPLTDKSRRKLQSTENFIDEAIFMLQIFTLPGPKDEENTYPSLPKYYFLITTGLGLGCKK